MKFTVGPLAENSYLLADENSREAWIIDPGAEAERFLAAIDEHGLRLTSILHTHAHGDHIGADAALVEATGAAIFLHAAEADWLLDPEKNLSALFGESITAPPADHVLAEGDTLRLGSVEFVVYHTPGHSPGSVSFYTPGHLFCGDLLFAGSVGRTDIPGSDQAALVHSLREKVYLLPDDTVVYAGHGPETTLGKEKRTNPFVRA